MVDRSQGVESSGFVQDMEAALAKRLGATTVGARARADKDIASVIRKHFGDGAGDAAEIGLQRRAAPLPTRRRSRFVGLSRYSSDGVDRKKAGAGDDD